MVLQLDEITIGDGRLYLQYSVWALQADADSGQPPDFVEDHLIDLARLQPRDDLVPRMNGAGNYLLIGGGTRTPAQQAIEEAAFLAGTRIVNPWTEIAFSTVTRNALYLLRELVDPHVLGAGVRKGQRTDRRAKGFAPKVRSAATGQLATALQNLVGSRVTL